MEKKAPRERLKDGSIRRISFMNIHVQSIHCNFEEKTITGRGHNWYTIKIHLLHIWLPMCARCIFISCFPASAISQKFRYSFTIIWLRENRTVEMCLMMTQCAVLYSSHTVIPVIYSLLLLGHLFFFPPCHPPPTDRPTNRPWASRESEENEMHIRQ